jgi:hypothetical protein
MKRTDISCNDLRRQTFFTAGCERSVKEVKKDSGGRRSGEAAEAEVWPDKYRDLYDALLAADRLRREALPEASLSRCPNQQANADGRPLAA